MTLSLLLSSGPSNICSMEGKDIQHLGTSKQQTATGYAYETPSPQSREATGSAAGEYSTLTHSSLCRPDVIWAIWYAWRGLGPCRRWWSVRRRSRENVRLEGHSSKNTTTQQKSVSVSTVKMCLLEVGGCVARWIHCCECPRMAFRVRLYSGEGDAVIFFAGNARQSSAQGGQTYRG